MRKLHIGLLALFLMGVQVALHAYIDPTRQRSPRSGNASEEVSFRENCDNAVSQIDQQINNVRARLTTGGDVWWDGNDGRYIVPKPPPGVPEVSSIFAGAVWLGGKDPAGNLKVAAQTYGRGSGNFDFYPGPLNPGNPNYPGGAEADPARGTVGRDTCAAWDKFFVVKGENIERHIRNYQAALAAGMDELDVDDIPIDVLGWPARGNTHFEGIHQFRLPNTNQGLAGYWDQNFNGRYEPELGDYPIVFIEGCTEKPPVSLPDEMIFWVYNDAGNVHRETDSENRIQMEVQVQAFAYQTNDDINNMTFQRYRLINRAIETIDSCFFAMWVDPDLGCYTDDYIGCDVSRSLAYVYNADNLDGTSGCTCDQGINTYCDEVPILGVDYFRGPKDEFGNELGMSSFTYFNNASVTPTPPPGTTDPDSPQEYYYYLSGRWRDGTPFTFGDDAYQDGERIPYAFTDAPNVSDGWSMCAEQLPVGDRRTLQATGPLKLLPGATNELIVGVVWVPDQSYPCPSISRLQRADDIAQDLFDNCFELTRGPDAPDVDWIELDQEIIAVFTNEDNVSNNAGEAYVGQGLGIPPGEDSLYRFEGYQLYQLSGPNVSLADIDDDTKVRLVYQVDLNNDIARVFNWFGLNPEDGTTPTTEIYYEPKLMVNGANQGLRHTFRITEDQFAEGDRRLVNHRKYYFAAVAYAHNEYLEFDPFREGDFGQQTAYLAGDRNIGDGDNPFYTVIPRKIFDRQVQAQYGEGPVVTRIDGVGTGNNFLDLHPETVTEIEKLIREDNSGAFSGQVTYKEGESPINVQIFNPLEVKNGEYELTFTDDNMGNSTLDAPTLWTLKNLSNPSAPVITAEKPISELNEQIIREYGFSVTIAQVAETGADPQGTNGVIGAEEEYRNPDATPWLFGIKDNTIIPTGNPVQDGTLYNYVDTDSPTSRDYDLDPLQRYSNIGNGYFVPYVMAAHRPNEQGTDYYTPAWRNTGNNNSLIRSGTNRLTLDSLISVDIVFTSDKSLWSRCVVIETIPLGFTQAGLLAEGNKRMFDLRSAASVGKDDNDNDGKPDPDNSGTTGMGWFPGYAVNVETGERLNIFFGENSYYNGEAGKEGLPANGADMMWNPNADLFTPTSVNFGPENFPAGGSHFVYVAMTPYNECADFRTALSATSAVLKVPALKRMAWAGFIVTPTPFKSYKDGLIPEDLTVKLRVRNPYQVRTGTGDFNGYPTYRFTLEGKEALALDEPAINEALQSINVVPNPYYGFSEYEDSQFENIVKITNLPSECTVTIYSLEGKFIRKYERNEVGAANTSPNRPFDRAQINPDLEWDLKNFRGIPVSSGVYIIHVAAPGLGERTLKWFGVNRQFDPSGL